MISIEKFAFLLCATLAYGASVRQTSYQPLPQVFRYSTNFTSLNNDNDLNVINLKENEIDQTDYPVVISDNFDIEKMIAKASNTLMDMFSTMEVSEQNLQSIVQLVVPLLSLYLGPFSPAVLQLLTGLATMLIKSVIRAVAQ